MNLSEFSVNKPITTLMAILSIVVLGVLALQRLPLMFYPDLSSSTLRVQVSYPSSSPEEVERLITRPIEEIMGTVSHLDQISSSSSSVFSQLTISPSERTNTSTSLQSSFIFPPCSGFELVFIIILATNGIWRKTLRQ